MNGRSPDDAKHDGGDEGRLPALLRELIQSEGQQETADLLGASTRTLQRTLASGRLTARMRDALERHLLSGAEAATTTRQDEHGEVLEQRLERLEERVGALAHELRAGLAAGRATDASGLHADLATRGAADGGVSHAAQGARRSGDPPSRAETPPLAGNTAQEPASVAGLRPVMTERQRLHRLVVSEEPESGDAEVYGEA